MGSYYKKEAMISQTKPPVMLETQTWKSYEEKVLEWLRMTSIAPDKVVGNIVNMGLQKHTILHKLATGFMDEYDFPDEFDESDLPRNWLKNGEDWEDICGPYTYYDRSFDKLKYDALWGIIRMDRWFQAARQFLARVTESQRLGKLDA